MSKCIVGTFGRRDCGSRGRRCSSSWFGTHYEVFLAEAGLERGVAKSDALAISVEESHVFCIGGILVGINLRTAKKFVGKRIGGGGKMLGFGAISKVLLAGAIVSIVLVKLCIDMEQQ